MSRASEETAKRRERILKPEGDRLGAISALLGDGPTDCACRPRWPYRGAQRWPAALEY